MTTLTARWDGDRYYVGGRGYGWISEDGDTWMTASGRPVTGPRFDVCSILLLDGPRDGEVVA